MYMQGALLSFFWVVRLFLIGIVSGLVTQTRWCYIQDNGQQASWVVYNDSLSSCVACGGVTRLFTNRISPAFQECCDNQFMANCGILCQEYGAIGCENGNSFCADTRCDGFNDCGNAEDEIKVALPACDKSECSPGQYTCREGFDVQCFSTSSVCDGKKDCFSGSDEENCLYFGGRCPGFRCTELPQCITSNKICDGRKDCYDGSDEINCLQYYLPGECNENTFKCNDVNISLSCDGNVINLSQVCDGQQQCVDGRDEHLCYTWSSWSLWTTCDCPSFINGTHTRNRNCATFHDIHSHSEGECNGETEESETCICYMSSTTEPSNIGETSTTPEGLFLSTTLLVIFCLSGVLVIIIIAALIYACWLGFLRRRKKQLDQSSPYIPRLSLGGDSVFSTNASIRSTHATHSSPATSQIYRRSIHGSVPNIINASVLQQNGHYPYSTVGSKRNTPLPARPGEEDAYSHIKETPIDPYAETRSVGVSRSRSTVSLAASFQTVFKEKSFSPTSSNYDSDGDAEDGVSIVRTYSLSSLAQRKRTISRVPIETLGPAPQVPKKRFSKSTEDLSSDGYMVSMKRPAGTTYTSMTSSSPERTNRYRVSLATALPVDKMRHKHGLNKSQRLSMQSNRYLRRQNRNRATGNRLQMSKSVYVPRSRREAKNSEDLSYYSDSYATMKNRTSFKNNEASINSDHESLANSSSNIVLKSRVRNSRKSKLQSANSEDDSKHPNHEEGSSLPFTDHHLSKPMKTSLECDSSKELIPLPSYDPPKLKKSPSHRKTSLNPPLATQSDDSPTIPPPPDHEPPKLLTSCNNETNNKETDDNSHIKVKEQSPLSSLTSIKSLKSEEEKHGYSSIKPKTKRIV